MAEIEVTGNPQSNNFDLIAEYNLTINYSASAGQASTTRTHGLGYVPGVMAFLDSGGEILQPFNFLVIEPDGDIIQYFDCNTTKTEVTVRLTVPTGSSAYGSPDTAAVKVYLFRTRANQ